MRAAWRVAVGCCRSHEPSLLQQLHPQSASLAQTATQFQPDPCLSSSHLAPLSMPAHGQHGQQQASYYSSQAQPSTNWKEHTRTKFNIRPSLMSPLYSTYQQEIQKDLRRQAVAHLLDAHNLLAQEIDGLDMAQVERTAEHRAASLQLLSQDLRSLASRTNLATCSDRTAMLGFFALLEQQLGSVQGGSQAVQGPGGAVGIAGGRGGGPGAALQAGLPDVDDAQLYYDVAHGRVPVWEAWQEQFANRYAGTPSLPPLVDIYLAEQRGPGSQTTGAEGEEGVVRLVGYQGRRGARMDASGTVMAEGKRKTSSAKILLREGQGRFTVNGLPYDAYFTQLDHRAHMVAPLLQMPRNASSFNMDVEVTGGGRSAQAQAVKTALARGLQLFPHKLNQNDRFVLKHMARWDGRRVERKKPGRLKARAGFTYVRR